MPAGLQASSKYLEGSFWRQKFRLKLNISNGDTNLILHNNDNRLGRPQKQNIQQLLHLILQSYLFADGII